MNYIYFPARNLTNSSDDTFYEQEGIGKTKSLEKKVFEEFVCKELKRKRTDSIDLTKNKKIRIQ